MYIHGWARVYCGAVAYDAGAWTDLLPIQGDASS